MQAGRKISWGSAGAIVVANMIGTGVFTSLGLQLNYVNNTWTILSLWVIGGVISLFGAFSYAELGTRLPRSGGEYHFLSRIFHPFIGYLSGWVSLTVGFSASVALSAMAMSAYLGPFFRMPEEVFALLVILILSLVHSVSIRQSSSFQNILTVLKVLLMLGMIGFGFYRITPDNAIDWSAGWQLELFSPAYAVSLIYVVYAYSGWNAAAYIVGEIKQPRQNLPKALIGGTLLVSLLFIGLQVAFLNQAPIADLKNKIEVGQIVAEAMFGYDGGRMVSFLIAALLISGISAMIWIGPRVTRAMAAEYRIWHFFARDNAYGIPVRAIWLQTAISVFMVITSSFEQVLLYSGFVLQLFTSLTVAGVFFIRKKGGKSAGYRSPGYPWIQIIYLAFSVWVLVFLLYDKPRESLLGLINLVAGALSYYLSKDGYSKRESRLGSSSENGMLPKKEQPISPIDEERGREDGHQNTRTPEH